MVERWMQSKGNPYMGPARRMQPVRKVAPTFRVTPMPTPFKGKKAYYGKPIQLFKDSDRDGVPNVFDCKPYNKRKQDVMHPPNFGSSGIMDMYSRAEAARQNKLYQKQLAEWNRQQQLLLEEQQRLETPTVTNVYPTYITYPSQPSYTGKGGTSTTTYTTSGGVKVTSTAKDQGPGNKTMTTTSYSVPAKVIGDGKTILMGDTKSNPLTIVKSTPSTGSKILSGIISIAKASPIASIAKAVTTAVTSSGPKSSSSSKSSGKK